MNIEASCRPATSQIQVRKYGGSSLAGPTQVATVAEAIAERHRKYGPLVIVVSAQGGSTDSLLMLAERGGGGPSGRETDQLLTTGECASAALLAMALHSKGVPAASLAGWQAGIHATGQPGKGVISWIDTSRITSLLATGTSVVVAGFQGIDQHGDLLTLGRGGSDTTAVALTVALGADRCEIYTDVAGIFTADPRVVAEAQVMPTVDVSVMVEMAFAGARVMHSRAVELAAMNGVDIHVRSSALPSAGSMIVSGENENVLESNGVVIGVTHDVNVVRVLLQAVTAGTDLAAEVLRTLADNSVPVDLVARSGPHESEFRMGFTMPRTDLDQTRHLLEAHARARQGWLQVDTQVGKVSLIGMGLLNRPQYTARLLSVLSGVGISTSWISTSQLRTSVIVPLDRVTEAVELLHREFGLNRNSVPDSQRRAGRLTGSAVEEHIFPRGTRSS